MKPSTATTAALAQSELDDIRALIEQRSAILFEPSRERFFSGRVREFLEEKGLGTGADLFRRIQSSGVEYEELLERLLTQETSFFRYPAVFEALEKTVLPSVHQRKLWQNPRKLRIWSAGCSTGEEPYSIAITLCEALKLADAWDIEILATDISRKALRLAQRAAYSERSLLNVTPSLLDSYFEKTKQGFHVKPRIKRLVSFAQMNLAEAPYVGKVDCIFCMNVLMYFSPARRLAALQLFHEALEPGGYFLLGHAETLSDVSLDFEPMVQGDCRIYRKPASKETRRGAAAAETL